MNIEEIHDRLEAIRGQWSELAYSLEQTNEGCQDIAAVMELFHARILRQCMRELYGIVQGPIADACERGDVKVVMPGDGGLH